MGSFCGFCVGSGKADRQGAKDAKRVKLAVGSFCRNCVGWCALVRGDGGSHRDTKTPRETERLGSELSLSLLCVFVSLWRMLLLRKTGG